MNEAAQLLPFLLPAQANRAEENQKTDLLISDAEAPHDGGIPSADGRRALNRHPTIQRLFTNRGKRSFRTARSPET
ncbi:hypothetical protein [Bradyrhizobium sp. AZCC 2289]|uniref:hypothetical protein n=1 Tax=Bradyrhizobium sp. AZCC 2289 TaxID=3117026 RepID=UPI002FF29D1E